MYIHTLSGINNAAFFVWLSPQAGRAKSAYLPHPTAKPQYIGHQQGISDFFILNILFVSQ